jgi:hypothetical protein
MGNLKCITEGRTPFKSRKLFKTAILDSMVTKPFKHCGIHIEPFANIANKRMLAKRLCD